MKQAVRFAAINPYREQIIDLPTEVVDRRSAFVKWGLSNTYPDYLCALEKEVSTLRAIIQRSIDYIVGNGVEIHGANIPQKNEQGESIESLVAQMAHNYLRYGGFAVHVMRNAEGGVADIEVVDLRYLRSDKDNEVFFYSEEWGKGNAKYERYPKFVPEFTDNTSSIYLVKGDKTQVYPEPMYLASIKACELERAIDEYHLNAIKKGFMGSYIINFNNGRPEDEEASEIVKNVEEKFCGASNAGQIAVAFNDSVDNAITIQKLEMQDFGESYNTAAKNARQRIFTAFGANPNLFGIATENIGFSKEEYLETFELYNRTHIYPVQQKIVRAFDHIFGGEKTISIKPFSLNLE